MTIIQAIILGIVQGLTEFLPISSSAHLVIVPYLLNWTFPESQVFIFDVLIQIGTLLAVIIHFWSDLIKILKAWIKGILDRKPFETSDSRFGWLLIVSTIPAGILGLLIKDYVESVFQNPFGTAGLLLVTALFLFLGERFGKKNRKLGKLTWIDAAWIGLWQAVSIFPGISRSGSTITGGLLRDLDRESSARYSFLMAVPIMLAVGLLSVLDLIQVPSLSTFLPVLTVGFFTSAVVGYFSIRWLLRFVSRNSLYPFAIYCLVLGSLTMIYAVTFPKKELQISNGNTPLIMVQSSPSLDWLVPTLSRCAQNETTVRFEINISPFIKSPHDGIILQMDNPGDPGTETIVLGEDQIAFISNKQNTHPALSSEELIDIFSGKIKTWANGNEIHTYVYPQKMDLQKFFTDICASIS